MEACGGGIDRRRPGKSGNFLRRLNLPRQCAKKIRLRFSRDGFIHQLADRHRHLFIRQVDRLRQLVVKQFQHVGSLNVIGLKAKVKVLPSPLTILG